jgi:hypothetical protein
VNNHPILEKLMQTALTPEQHTRLFGMIAATFKSAIESRSPKNRPPGKAGLRAEKGYYRLLYLEGSFRETVTPHQHTNPEPPACDWNPMIGIVRQLTDIPELRSEILEGIETALNEVADPTQTVD